MAPGDGAASRGGLRYPVEVIDRFSANLAKFRDDIRKSRAEFTKFRRTARRLSRDTSKGEVAARKQSAAASREEARAQKEKLQALRAGQQEQKKVERFKKAIFQDQRREAKRLEQVEKKSAAARARANKAADAQAKRATSSQRRLRAEVTKTSTTANRLGATFRRLIGVLAALQSIRLLAGGAKSFVSQAVQFNRTIEDSRIGIASLLTSLGRFRNEQGDILTGAEGFQAALAESDRVLEKIRQRSLATVATFQELQVAFQAGLGPGLEAGLNLDEIVTVAERVSQAAAAIKVPQGQLVEEIRSLLRGTATSRTSLVASILFGGAQNANRVIRQARETGTVFEVISKGLDSFRFAANATQLTFTGLLARIRDASSIAGGRSALPFFDELKGLLSDIGGLFVDIERDAEGAIANITPKPQTVSLLRKVFDALRDGVAIIRRGIGQISVGAVAASFEVLGDVIRGIASFLVGLVQGTIRGFALLGVLAKKFAGAIGGIDLKLLQEVGKLVSTLAPSLIAAVVAGASLRAILGLLRSPTVRFLNILGLATVATQKIGTAALGLPLTFKDAVDLVGLTFSELFDRIKLSGEIAFKTLANNVVGVFTDPIGTILDSFLGLFSALLSVAAVGKNLGLITEETRQGLDTIVTRLEAERGTKNRGLLPFSKEEIASAKVRLSNLLEDSQKKFDAFAAKVAARDADENTKFNPISDKSPDNAASAITLALKAANDALKGLLGAGLVNKDDIKEAVKGAVAEGAKEGGDEGSKTSFEGKGTEAQPNRFGRMLQNFSATLEIMQKAFNKFVDFVADSIIDAFDPNKDTTIKERFGKFLQDISRIIIRALAKLAIAKVLLEFGIGTTGGATAGGGAAIGKAKGGRIPSRRSARASLAHYTRAQGLAEGGRPTPPAGISPKDNVPIWAQEGEFMMRVAAVRKYGVAFMENLNRGLLDPLSLPGLSGNRRRVAQSRRRSPGFQTGGEITSGAKDAAREVAAATNVAGLGGGGGPGLSVGFIPANDQTVERLMAGGRQAVLDFIDENGADIDGRLARFRS